MSIVLQNNKNYEFDLYCTKGNVEKVKQYQNCLNKNDLNELFFLSCANNYFEIAKLLYDTNEIDLNYRNQAAFRWCCYKGYIHIVKWLCSLGKGVLEIDVDTFSHTCAYNKLETIQLLFANFNINLSEKNHQALKWSIHNKNINMCAYLFTQYEDKSIFVHLMKSYMKNRNKQKFQILWKITIAQNVLAQVLNSFQIKLF